LKKIILACIACFVFFKVYSFNVLDQGSCSELLTTAKVLKGIPLSSVQKDRPSALVTGGLGFIGSHVVEELLSRHFQVFIYDDESNGHNFNSETLNLHGDIRVVNDFKQLNNLQIQIDYVVHLAASISVAESMTMPDKYNETNIQGSAKVFFWAQSHGVKHVVAASSAAIYGDPPANEVPIKEILPYRGKSPYAWSKWKMERIMESMSKEYGFCCTALRFFNVYGPRQDPHNPYSGVISLFMEKAKSGQDVVVLGDGGQTRDFIYVKDIARAIVKALLGGRCKYDHFSVCTGKETKVQDLAHTVVKVFESKSDVTNKPARNGDIRKSVCNPHKLNNVLGFVPEVALEEGLKHTKEWFLSQ